MMHLGATAHNGLMSSTDLVLITSGQNHVFAQLSWTKADHPVKVSGRFLKRPGSLSSAKFYTLSILLYREIRFVINNLSCPETNCMLALTAICIEGFGGGKANVPKLIDL